ncbi:transposase [Tenacibaculum maritimum]|uniref:transposase n=1 Tax=Tenacibaculum maritimum TaxID=107401 RepID=UPI00132FD9E4|nr:transposase [Tenacibaculum maritimum]
MQYIYKIPSVKRSKVKEINLDMPHSMKLIVKRCFPKAVLVTDRFYVQKLGINLICSG